MLNPSRHPLTMFLMFIITCIIEVLALLFVKLYASVPMIVGLAVVLAYSRFRRSTKASQELIRKMAEEKLEKRKANKESKQA